MPEELQPVLLEDYEITTPGFHLRRLALNQHMPRVERLSEHVHDFYQMLLYLRGHGTQHTANRSLPVERGTWLVIPPGCRHRFTKEQTIRPVCLAIDFDRERGNYRGRQDGKLNASQLASIEKWLVALNEEESRGEKRLLNISALILRIVALFESASAPAEENSIGPVEKSVRSAIARRTFEDLSPHRISRDIGISLDHLNRRLREECGMTVGSLIRKVRLQKAGHLLRSTQLSISEIGSEIGLDDQNYFARWFRKYTGQPPGRWREAMQAGR